jgi:hypothetical protein
LMIQEKILHTFQQRIRHGYTKFVLNFSFSLV